MTRLLGAAFAAAALAAVLGSCESSQDKSARLKADGGKAFEEKGLDVRRQSRDVRIVGTKVLQDKNGAAAVVVLRSTASRPAAGVQVEIKVLGAKRKALFANNEPGLEPSLTGPSILTPGKEFAWVHDQVVATAPVKAVDATAGSAKDTPAEVPEIDVSQPKLSEDPVSGTVAAGTVVNKSEVEQRELVIYCVARKGDEIVAAGRGGIPRLKAGQRRSYQVFFIGDPKGAQLTVEAPATVLD